MQDSVIQERVGSIDTESLKVPPHSVEAEQSVLGGLMLANDAWIQVADRISEIDFYRKDHRLIFSALRSLAEDNKPCDVVTVSEWLELNGELSNAGGLGYLGDLAKSTPSAANIVAYTGIVRERSVLRQLITISSKITEAAFTPEGRPSSELLDDAERLIFEIAEQGARTQGGFRAVKDLLADVVDRIDLLFQSDSSITGVATGFTDIDELTSGMQKGDLVIVAGRPSMGKTAFAMNIVEHAAIGEGLSVGVFSMEMPADQLAMRMMSSLGRIDSHRVRTGKLQDEDWPRLTSAVGMLSEAKLFIDDSPGLTPTEIRARARRIAREHSLDMIVVDYLQLMQVSGNKENRATEISEISRSLKGLAKELNCPVIALSQLNRAVEQREDKRPRMSDLRESGSIEQDADVIMFIYRDEVYNPESPEKGRAEIHIAKQRNGPIGTRTLTFRGQYTRFENFTEGGYGGEGYG